MAAEQRPDRPGQRRAGQAAHSAGVVQGERPGEDAQHRQRSLLPGLEQFVAAAHHSGQALALAFGAAGVPGQQRRLLLQNLLHRQRADPARHQLDGQRHRVQATAQLGDGVPRNASAPLSPGSRSVALAMNNCTASEEEMSDTGAAAGARQRWHRPAHLAGHPSKSRLVTTMRSPGTLVSSVGIA